MKYLIIILALLTACKKEYTEPVNIIPPQEVYYTVNSMNESKKRIQIELWSVKEKTSLKSLKIDSIDTIVTAKEFKITLIQTERPVMYCISSLKVDVLEDGYDNLSASIMSNSEGIGKGGSCPSNNLYIEETFLRLYSN